MQKIFKNSVTEQFQNKQKDDANCFQRIKIHVHPTLQGFLSIFFILRHRRFKKQNVAMDTIHITIILITPMISDNDDSDSATKTKIKPHKTYYNVVGLCVCISNNKSQFETWTKIEQNGSLLIGDDKNGFCQVLNNLSKRNVC